MKKIINVIVDWLFILWLSICLLFTRGKRYRFVLWFLLVPEFGTAQTHIYLSSESNVQSSMETYTVYDCAAIIHKPEAATTGIAWLSYSDISQPASYGDTLIIDVNNAGQWQFYSAEVEKYFLIELRTAGMNERFPEDKKTIILYEFRNFNLTKYEK